MSWFQIESLFSKEMVMLNSLEFLFLFLPLFLLLYYIAPSKYRNSLLFLGSILFYAMGDPAYVLLLLAAVSVNYLLAKKLWSDGNQHIWIVKKRKKWLIAAIALDVFLLAAFKVLHAWDDSILMPLGISFFTFKMISYQVDAFHGRMKQPAFLNAAVYFCMFPQIVSGPIMRYEQTEKALSERCCNLDQLEEGIELFILGLSAKVILADRMALLWNEIQTIGFESISTPLAWIGAAAYSLELYFDFAGYSLMAGGICRMLGFPLIRNFNQPYGSHSIREFFRRWHITLGTWFRDYIYIPLGGSRTKGKKWILNLFLVWLITGIWHGGSLNFVIWGMILFLLILAEKLFWGKWLEKHKVFGSCYVVLLMPLTWMIFAITNLRDLFVYFGRLFPFGGEISGIQAGDFLKFGGSYGIFLAAAVFCCIPGVYRLYEKYRKHPAAVAGMVILFWISIYLLSNAANNPFLYSDF